MTDGSLALVEYLCSRPGRQQGGVAGLSVLREEASSSNHQRHHAGGNQNQNNCQTATTAGRPDVLDNLDGTARSGQGETQTQQTHKQTKTTNNASFLWLPLPNGRYVT